jgi:hypothetical protein
MEYNTLGIQGTAYTENIYKENKTWQEVGDTRDDRQEHVWRYPGVQVGVVEVDGGSRVVEAPTGEK